MREKTQVYSYPQWTRDAPAKEIPYAGTDEAERKFPMLGNLIH